MARYLLFDSGCPVCTGLAREIEHRSDDHLVIRSLHDPTIQALLDQAKPGWSWEPTLLEVEGEQARAFTGIGLRVRMVKMLGPRRAWRVAQLVAQSQLPTDVDNPSRRRFLKRSGIATAGLAVFGLQQSRATAATKAGATPGAPVSVAAQEGLKSSSVEALAEGVRISFTHAQPARSGTLEIDPVDGPLDSYRLVRDGRAVIQIVADASKPSVKIEDHHGRKAHLLFVDGQWSREGTDADVMIEENKADIALAAAMHGDYQMSQAQAMNSSEAATSRAVQAASGCRCSVRGVRDGGWGSSRSHACYWATNNVNVKCSNRWCIGCCRLLPRCDCACAVEDYLCHCGRTGFYCTSCSY